MKLFDSHCHLNDEKFDDNIESVIKQIKEEGLAKCIVVGCDLESSYRAVEFCKKYEWAYLAAGILASDFPQNEEELWKTLEEFKSLVRDNKESFVAIGEFGLDYHWCKDNVELQKKLLIQQINFANECELPIIIHTRDAVSDTIDILKSNKIDKGGVIHCCPQNRELIKEVLNLGFYISFAGPITFKSSKNAEEIINLVPNDRLLIETDSPYLTPEPVRGTQNIPSNVRYVAEKIAKAKGIDIESVCKMTFDNTERLFQIK